MRKQTVNIIASRKWVTLELVDFDCMIIMHIKIKTWIAKS
jgi:hypothetical protein